MLYFFMSSSSSSSFHQIIFTIKTFSKFTPPIWNLRTRCFQNRFVFYHSSYKKSDLGIWKSRVEMAINGKLCFWKRCTHPSPLCRIECNDFKKFPDFPVCLTTLLIYRNKQFVIFGIYGGYIPNMTNYLFAKLPLWREKLCLILSESILQHC